MGNITVPENLEEFSNKAELENKTLQDCCQQASGKRRSIL